MNNANVGYDCRNNADNCYFRPVYDETEELSYAKRYQNMFDQDISEFVSTEILWRQIEEESLRNSMPLTVKMNITMPKNIC